MGEEQRKQAMDEADVFTPPHARSWVWDHAYLLHSRPREIFCRTCCPLSGGVPVPESDWHQRGRCSYHHASTSGIIAHLAVKHDIGPGGMPGAGAPPYEQSVQHQISCALVLGFQIMDFRCDSLFESTGARTVMKQLLPRVCPPSHQTVVLGMESHRQGN